MEIIYLTPELWHTSEISELAKALSKFNELLHNVSIKKDAKSHRNTYMSLDNILHAIRPLLPQCGLSISQDLAGNFLVTTLMHESGQFKGSAMPFYPMQDNKMNALQAIGGGISYGKRYAISALLGISSDVDDDGEGMKGMKPTVLKKEPYPVERYPKGAKAIFENKTTIEEIRKTFIVSETAKAVIEAHVLNLKESEEKKAIK